MESFETLLNDYPIIAAVRDHESVAKAVKTPISAVFLLGGSLFDLPDMIKLIHDSGKRAFMHIDLADGIANDETGVEWCVKKIGADGIISTRPKLIKKASELGAITIQRLFIMDSSSFAHGVKLLKTTPPDMAEVLPGIAPKAISRLKQELDKPVIAGGMITEKSEIFEALKAGALAVSVSDEHLWTI